MTDRDTNAARETASPSRANEVSTVSDERLARVRRLYEPHICQVEGDCFICDGIAAFDELKARRDADRCCFSCELNAKLALPEVPND